MLRLMLAVSCCTFLHIAVCAAQGGAIQVQTPDGTMEVNSLRADPFLAIGSLELLQEKYSVVKDTMPDLPFLMNGQWVLPGAEPDTLRTFPEDPEARETFSHNGDYVVRLYWPDVRPGSGHRLPPTHADRMELLRTDGTLVWETGDAPARAVVTNDGTVVAFPRTGENVPLSLRFYGPEGTIVNDVTEPLQNLERGAFAVLEDESAVLAWGWGGVVLLDRQGVPLWSFSQSRDAGLDYWYVGSRAPDLRPRLDPLGRGLMVPLEHSGMTRVLFLDPATGEVQGRLGEDRPSPLPNYFSPGGTAAAFVYGDVTGLVDWRTGEEYFRQHRSSKHMTNPRKSPVSVGLAASVSDDGPKVAFPVGRWGVTIFTLTGDSGWFCHVSGPKGRQHAHLSADGHRIGISLMDTSFYEPPVLHALLVYWAMKGIPANRNVEPGMLN